MYKFILVILALCVFVACSARMEKAAFAPEMDATTAAPASSPDMPMAAERNSFMDDSEEKAYSDVPMAAAAPRPSQSGLKAGYADDNAGFNAYLDFLDKYSNVARIDFPVQERFIFTVLDRDGKPISDAIVSVSDIKSTGSANGNKLMQAQTYANGQTLFFPLAHSTTTNSYTVEISYKNTKQSFTIDRKAERQQSFTLPISSQPATPVPVDILFVLDTTGSMGEEINRLRDMLLIIHDNLLTLPVELDLRFGMVMYKDRGDEYLTKKISFTNNANAFQRELLKIRADGGGDTPEDLQTALEVSLKEMGWRSEGVRLAYVITDAEAHLDYKQKFTLLSAAQLAQGKGIKLFSVGTGGLGIEGETNLRQIAQYTMGKYIFLTYGERGESDGATTGGNSKGGVSHHTGENFASENLEAVIIRFSKDEISAYARREIAVTDDYFEAMKGENNPKVLSDLFSQMITQLTSYSGMKIAKETTVAVLPITTDKALAANAEYFTEHLSQAAVLHGGWTAVERKDLQKILDEHALRLSGLTEDDAIELGSILGAQILVAGTLYEKDGSYELYMKLLRAESGEVLSVTRAKIEKSLGL